MVELKTGAIPVLEREELFAPPMRIEQANSYRTRGEPLQLVVNGAPGEWHSMKGGFHPGAEQQNKAHLRNAAFEVFYNPDTQQWLKTAAPEKNLSRPEQTIHATLRTSAEVARLALEIADLPDLADQIKHCVVDAGSQTSYGFVSPHIGPTLEFLIRTLRADYQRKATDFPDFFSNVYTDAFDQAVLLYLNHGYMHADPNPGNIALHRSDAGDTYHVVLIDFANNRLKAPLHYKSVPQDTSTDRYQSRVTRFFQDRIAELRDSYARETDKLHMRIDFPINRHQSRIQELIASHILPS